MLIFLQEVGCDLMLESGTIPDRCNVCGGDGSTCAYITAKNMNPYPYSGQFISLYFHLALRPSAVLAVLQ